MDTAIYLIALVLIVPVLYPVAKVVVGLYRRFSGTRLVTCPETRQPAAVEVDATRAILTAIAGRQILELQDCSRWPERRSCGQPCLRQIEAAPEDCLLGAIVARWYQGKVCAYCHRPVGKAHWLEHQPALLGPGGHTLEWVEIPPEKIPEVLETHLPVCWDCHVAETFRRQFPELARDHPTHHEEETYEVRSAK